MQPPRWEWLVVSLILLAWFGLNLATCGDYPQVWCDEIWFSEPAINLVQSGSFTTMVWPYQPIHTFPTVNCPIYSMAIAPWLYLTGTNLVAIRSFNYALIAVAALLLWVACWRFDLVRRPLHRLLFVVLLHLAYGMCYSYRCSRPDILGLVCLSGLLLSLQFKRQLLRALCLAGLSGLAVCIGLQVGLFAGLALFLGWLILRQVTLRELVVSGLSMVAAVGGLILFFAWKGVLSPFLASTLGFLGKQYAHQVRHTLYDMVRIVVGQTISNYMADFSMLVVSVGLVVLLVATWKRLTSRMRRLAVYCITLALVVPLIFNLVGHFAFYYSYMRFVPTALVLFALWSELFPEGSMPRPVLRVIVVTTVVGAMAVGLPLRFAVRAATAKLMPRNDVQRILDSVIRPDDVVCSDYAYFFEVKRITSTVYDRSFSPISSVPHIAEVRELTREQKDAVSVLVIRPKERDILTQFFGGSWSAATEPFGDMQLAGALGDLPVVGNRILHYLSQPQTERYQVQELSRTS